MRKWKQFYAIKNKNIDKILASNPDVPETSGIYMLTRQENGFKFAYIGQAKNLLSRLADHLNGYQHIDLSLKKHGLFSEQNQSGWQIDFVQTQALDEKEQFYIKLFADNGFQLYNHTTGSQNKGKQQLGHEKERKGYLQGKNQGEIATIKRIKVFFDKYLDFVIKGQPNAIKERKLKEFRELLESIEKKDGN